MLYVVIGIRVESVQTSSEHHLGIFATLEANLSIGLALGLSVFCMKTLRARFSKMSDGRLFSSELKKPFGEKAKRLEESNQVQLLTEIKLRM